MDSLAGLRVRSMEVALHARRYSMGVMDRTRQAADSMAPASITSSTASTSGTAPATRRGARRTAGVSVRSTAPDLPTRPKCINQRAAAYRARVVKSMSIAPESATARVSTANRVDPPVGEAWVGADARAPDPYPEESIDYASSMSSEHESVSAGDRIESGSRHGRKRLKRGVEPDTVDERGALHEAVQGPPGKF